MLAENNVRLITFPPHSSHIFQPQDLVTFGVAKKEMKYATSKFEPGSQADIISRAIKSIEKATISENNRSAFECAGLEINTSISPHRAIVNENALRQKITKYCFSGDEPQKASTNYGFMNKDKFV